MGTGRGRSGARGTGGGPQGTRRVASRDGPGRLIRPAPSDPPSPKKNRDSPGISWPSSSLWSGPRRQRRRGGSPAGLARGPGRPSAGRRRRRPLRSRWTRQIAPARRCGARQWQGAASRSCRAAWRGRPTALAARRRRRAPRG